MSGKRASISISGSLYARLKAHALKHGVSIASVVEKVVAPDLGHGAAKP